MIETVLDPLEIFLFIRTIKNTKQYDLSECFEQYTKVRELSHIDD